MRLIDLVNQFPCKNWNWDFLSSNPNISMQDVLDNPDKKWVQSELAKNPNQDPDIEKTWKYHNKRPISFKEVLAKKSKQTLKELLSKPLEQMDWGFLSENVTMKDILDNPHEPWKGKRMSVNPHITVQDVFDNPYHLWDWQELSRNTFGWTSRSTELLLCVKHFRARVKQLKSRGCEDEANSLLARYKAGCVRYQQERRRRVAKRAYNRLVNVAQENNINPIEAMFDLQMAMDDHECNKRRKTTKVVGALTQLLLEH